MNSKTVYPVSNFGGELSVPGDKSVSQRISMLAALAKGTSEIHGFLTGEDAMSTLGAMCALGASARFDGDVLKITGTGGKFMEPANPLDMGNSGTGTRLLAGLLAGQNMTVTMTGDALPEQLVSAGTGLAADADDLLLGPAWQRHAKLRPLCGFSALSIDLGQLFLGDLIERIVLMHVDGERVKADGEFHGTLSGFLFGLFDFSRLGVAAGRGHVNVAIAEGGQADTRAAPGHLDAHVRIHFVVFLSPGLRKVNHGVRPFDLDG